MLAEGYLYKEISDTLGLSYETVHNYILRMYEKLQVRPRSQAVARYYGQRGTSAKFPKLGGSQDS